MTNPRCVFIICTSPRSGSNLLCEFIESTGRMGKPREYFNAMGRRLFDDPDFPDEPEAQVRRAFEIGASADGVFGLKVFAEQMPFALQSPTFCGLLPRAHFIHLRRDDLLGQAVSLARATRTGQYRASQAQIREPAYDAGDIEAALTRIALEHASWRAYFARNDLDPLQLTYEELVSAPDEVVGAIAKRIGVEGPLAIDRTKVRLTRQADALTQAWRRRFVAERSDLCSGFDLLASRNARASRPRAALARLLRAPKRVLASALRRRKRDH